MSKQFKSFVLFVRFRRDEARQKPGLPSILVQHFSRSSLTRVPVARDASSGWLVWVRLQSCEA